MRSRTVRERVACFLGLHDYGPPHVMESATLTGERAGSEWDLALEENEGGWVEQHCQRVGCTGRRKRPGLSAEEVRDG